MRPLRLEMKGLRSYRKRVEVDLRGRDLLAIVGPTGSGKSSILEAIVFALYNGTTWGGRETSSLICGDGDGIMSVTLEFAADGKIWRVFRRISESLSPPSMHRLECLTPGEDGFEALNGAAHVDRQIEELVGLTRSAFVTSVLLPQGRFQDLLQASGTERTGILRGIFRLGVISTVRSRAREHREEELLEQNRLHEERARFLPDPAGTIESAAAIEKELAPRFEKLRAWHQAAEEADKRLSEVSAERDALARSGEALEDAAAEASSVSEKLSSLAGLAERFEAEEEALLSERAGARAAHEKARRHLEELLERGEDPDELSRAHQRALALPAKLRDLRALSDSLARREEELQANREALSAAISEYEAAEREAASSRDERDKAREREGVTRDATVRLARDAGELRRVHADLEQAGTELVRAEKDLDGAQRAVEDLSTAHEEAEGLYLEHVRAESELKVAVMAHPGEPCPICKRKLPEGFSGPSESEVEQEERILREAREAMKRRRGELDEAKGQVRTYEERAASLREACERLATEEEMARDGLMQAVAEIVESGTLSETEAANPEDVDAEEVALRARQLLEEAGLTPFSVPGAMRV